MIRKWLHNRKYKREPECQCGCRMIPTDRSGFDNYWKCIWNNCTWEAFTTSSYRVRFWKS